MRFVQDNMNDKAMMTISAVERDTGLGKDTLRVWERRYAFPQPIRDAKGERLYTPEQVERLRLIKRLMDQVNQTQDMKAAADLQSRIALENAKIQQNQTNLDMMARFMDIQEKVQVKKRQNRDRCILENRINKNSATCG